MDAFLTEINAFVREYLLGHEKEFDTPGSMPKHVYEAFSQRKLSHWWIPQEYGGRGIGVEASVDIVSDLAYGDAGIAFALFIPVLSAVAIRLFGNESQKKRFLSLGMSGSTMASERLAGSELLRISALAKRTGNGYTLQGEKYFSTNAGTSDFWVIYTRAEEEGAYKAFIVPNTTPGVRVVQRWPMIGLRSSGTYELALENVHVQEDAALEGNGLRILEVALNTSRLLIAASGIGIARRARDLCIEYAKTKKVNDVPLLRNEVFAAKMGQIEIYIDTMRSICKDAGREIDTIMNDPDASQLAYRRGMLKSIVVAKTMCGQLGWKVASMASEMFGGLGYTEHSLISKLVRDMRYISIVEAGDDVLRSLMYARFIPH